MPVLRKLLFNCGVYIFDIGMRENIVVNPPMLLIVWWCESSIDPLSDHISLFGPSATPPTFVFVIWNFLPVFSLLLIRNYLVSIRIRFFKENLFFTIIIGIFWETDLDLKRESHSSIKTGLLCSKIFVKVLLLDDLDLLLLYVGSVVEAAIL
jgi:hypothetical protein